MRPWLFTVASLLLVTALVWQGVFGEQVQGLGFILMIFAGPFVVMQLLFWLIHIWWRANIGELVIDGQIKLTEREIRTKLIRQWIRDQKTGGPLHGTPRPLTLDEEETGRVK